jgi:glycolate oxidase FAD binding subunit
LIWALVAPGTDLRARAGRYDGHAMLVRAQAATVERLGRFQPQPAPLEALAAGLRAKFDPRGILNPGLMG